MTEWNVLVGIPALVMGVMLIYAFRSYVFVVRGKASAHLAVAFVWMNIRTTGRSIWWDFFQGFDQGNSSNWVWNLIGLYASYHALKALHLLLPASERASWNLFTVVFYPRRLMRRVHGEDEE